MQSNSCLNSFLKDVFVLYGSLCYIINVLLVCVGSPPQKNNGKSDQIFSYVFYFGLPVLARFSLFLLAKSASSVSS